MSILTAATLVDEKELATAESDWKSHVVTLEKSWVRELTGDCSKKSHMLGWTGVGVGEGCREKGSEQRVSAEIEEGK